MPDKRTPEETTTWQKRFASQANNRAWALSESAKRSPEDDEEMLQAAHTAMYFWKTAGTTNNRAHAAMLLAHVYALLKLPNPANYYLAQSNPVFLDGECAPWEKAFAHAITAHVAAAAGHADLHASHHAAAVQLIAALADPEDREILNKTLKVIPQPRP